MWDVFVLEAKGSKGEESKCAQYAAEVFRDNGGGGGMLAGSWGRRIRPHTHAHGEQVSMDHREPQASTKVAIHQNSVININNYINDTSILVQTNE